MVVSKTHIRRTLPLNKVTDGTSAPAGAGVKRGFRRGDPSNLKTQIGKGFLVRWALSWPTYLGGTGNEDDWILGWAFNTYPFETNTSINIHGLLGIF